MIQIDWNPAPKTLRNFGLIGLVAFGLLGWMAYARWLIFSPLPHGAVMTTTCVLLALGAYCGLSAAIAPRTLKPLYIFLTVISFPIGFVMSYIVMTILFYLVITPIGLIFKIIGRDPMNRRFEPQAATYWVRRHPPADVKRYFRQF